MQTQIIASPTHVFNVSLKWDNEINKGIASSENKSPIFFAPPADFGGTDSVWSPEHLLAASLASCYMTTFLHFAKLLKVPVVFFQISAKAEFEKKDKSLEATRFFLYPKVELQNTPENHVVDNLFEKAKKYCFISNSIKGEVIVEPIFLTT